MILPALSRSEAETVRTARITGADYQPAFHEVGLGGKDEGKKALEAYGAALSEALSGFTERDDHSARVEFDASAAELIHQALPLTDDLVVEDDLWRYLACVESWGVLVWRHGSFEDGMLSLADAHLGLGGRWESLPKRLWLRAALSIDPDAADPYELARRGGSDFWASGILRRDYAACRPLVRALVRFQYPTEGKFEGIRYRPQTLTLGGVRDLYKRLQHYHAFLSLPVLDEADASSLLESLAADLPRV